MKVSDVRSIAKQHGIKAAQFNKTDLIREIQAEEGNPQCYQTGHSDCCGQNNCLWMEDCQKYDLRH
ncbi:MAG: SAP domain-containing protein [Desulfuromonas sp.]|nr:MAG: SAP domain-containing protein [Desulfuromonas sp.]